MKFYLAWAATTVTATSTLLAAQTNQFPINRGLLQSDMDANGKAITNAGNIVAGWSGAFYGNGIGLTNVAGGGGGGSFNANQFSTDPLNATIVKSGSLQSNNTFYSTSGNITFKGSGGQNTLLLSPANGAFFPLGAFGSELVASNGVGTATVDATGADGLLTSSNLTLNGRNITFNSIGNSIYGTNLAGLIPTTADTNHAYVFGAGTAAANGGPYTLKSATGTINIWTNGAGTHGIIQDKNFDFGDEWAITNSSAVELYDSGVGPKYFISGTWVVNAGVAPAPTVFWGTNYTTNFQASFVATTNFLFQPLSTNSIYVDPINGSDGFGVIGDPYHPFQNLTNILGLAQSNFTIYLGRGTNWAVSGLALNTNNVRLIGQGRFLSYICKNPSDLQVQDKSINAKTNQWLEGFSTDLAFIGGKDVTLKDIDFYGGFADNFLLASFHSNVVVDGCYVNMIGNDSTGGSAGLIDSAVISIWPSNTVIIKNSHFRTDRQNAGTITRRAIAVNSGTVDIRNTLIESVNANQAYGIIIPSTATAGDQHITIGENVTFKVSTTSGVAAAVTNAVAGNAAAINGVPAWTITNHTDVSATALTGGDILVFNAASGKWTNGGPARLTSLALITPGSTATTANLGIDTSGNIVTNSSPIGANGSQTPWTSTEDAAGFSLTNFGSLYSSNSLLASGATVYQTNSGFFPLFYLGTNSPLKTTSSSAIANGALGGSNIFIVESPGHPNDFAIRTNGAIVLGHPAASATVVNLGLSADGTITTNASPVGVVSASTDAAAWHTNGDNTASGQTGIWGYTNGNAMDMRMNLNGANGAAVLQFRTIANSEGVNIYMGNSNSPVSNTEFNLSLIGGSHNTAAAGLTGASIFGGQYNSVNNDYAAVMGGQSNLALGHYSVALGQAADAANDNSFVFNGIPNRIVATSGSGSDNGAVKFGITAFLEITNSNQGFSRDFGSARFSTNTTAARAATSLVTNSPINSMLYMGTNAPGNGKGTDIGNGSIGSTNLVQIDALLFPGALMVGTNGNVYASNTVQAATLVAVGATGSNFMGANLNISGTLNATALTNGASAGSLVQVTDANKKLIDATAAAGVAIARDGTAVTSISLATSNYFGYVVSRGYGAQTNLSTMSANMTNSISMIQTNASFLWLAPINQDQSGTYQASTVLLTNSAASGIVMTLPTGWSYSVGSTNGVNAGGINKVVWERYVGCCSNVTSVQWR